MEEFYVELRFLMLRTKVLTLKELNCKEFFADLIEVVSRTERN